MSMRVYLRSEVAGFMRTSEAFGAFSNMHAGFPLKLCGFNVPSTENYYQAMRYTHLPEIQEKILAEGRPMISKRLAYEHIDRTRSDWDKVKISVMRYALRLRYGHHPKEMTRVFDETKGRPIVEISRRDDFWGTREVDDRLEGQNILGRLWIQRTRKRARRSSRFPAGKIAGMELRAEVALHDPDTPFPVTAPDIPDCRICGHPVPSFTPEPVLPDQASLAL